MENLDIDECKEENLDKTIDGDESRDADDEAS